MIDMAGLDWSNAPEGGIYLMGHDTSAAQVARGGGGLLRSQKIKGWDGGRVIPGDVKTAREAIVAAGLDWEVDRHPIIVTIPVYGVPTEDNPSGVIGWEPQMGGPETRHGLRTGGYQVAPDHVLNVRRDTGAVLGSVGTKWTGMPNFEAASFLDTLVDNGDAKYLAGGHQDGGKRIWLCAQLDREVVLGGDLNERCVPLAFVSNGWDGTCAFTITVGPYRIACWNGQTIPLEGFVRQWRGRHTSGLTADKQLKVARETLELSIGYFDAWASEMERMMTVPMSTREVEQTIKLILPDPKPVGPEGALTDRQIKAIDKKRETVLTIYRDAPDLQHLGDTQYRFLNAVTDYSDWHAGRQDDHAALRSAEPSKLKDSAYRALVAL